MSLLIKTSTLRFRKRDRRQSEGCMSVTLDGPQTKRDSGKLSGPRRSSTAVSTRKINHGNSEGGRGWVWADGVGDRAGVRGGGVCDGGAGSESGDCREGIEGDREEFGAAGGEGNDNGGGAGGNSRAVARDYGVGRFEGL